MYPDHATLAKRGYLETSKKAEDRAHMMAIYFMHCNFVRLHQTLKVMPHNGCWCHVQLWEMSDMVKLVENWETDNVE
jgi:hypothetical protein